MTLDLIRVYIDIIVNSLLARHMLKSDGANASRQHSTRAKKCHINRVSIRAQQTRCEWLKKQFHKRLSNALIA